MKTDEEKIIVMQAKVEGRRIQSSAFGEPPHWEDCDNPGWNWYDYDYRIKSEPKQVPFTRADMTDEVRWVKHQNVVSLIQSIGHDSIVIGGGVGIVHGYEWLVNQGYEWSSSINGPWHPFTKEVA